MMTLKLLGLNLITGNKPLGSLDQADNVRINARGAAVRRPGLRRLVDLPATSCGLYAVDDTLRTVAPNGTSDTGLFPTIFLDKVDATDLHGRVQAVRLASGRRALWIEHVGGVTGQPALHITNVLPSVDEAGSAIALPAAFVQPCGLIGLYGRLWSLDKVSNRLRWSGLDDPDINYGVGYVRAWDEVEPTAQHGGSVDLGQGSSEPLALAEYRGRVAVFLRTQVQTWLPGQDGVDSLDQTVSGPGTRFPGTLAAISGDLIYADAGSHIRTIGTDSSTEGAQEGSIGEAVATLTQQLITPGGATPVAMFSRGLSSYLVGSGTTLLCLSITPGSGVHGWSRWSLPLPGPIDAMAEVRGLTYIRCGTALFYLEPEANDDQTAPTTYQPIPAVVDVSDTLMPQETKALMPPVVGRIGAILAGGPAQIAPVCDGLVRTVSTIQPHAPGPSYRVGRWPAWQIGLHLSADAAPQGWAIHGIFME